MFSVAPAGFCQVFVPPWTCPHNLQIRTRWGSVREEVSEFEQIELRHRLGFLGLCPILCALQAVTEEKKPKSEMASDRLSRRGRERATPAFKLGDNCRDKLLELHLSGAFLAIRTGIGFSGALNAMVMTPETHSSCIYAQSSARNELC